MEVHRMREKTFHVYVDSHDRSLLLQSLVELKNLLIQQYVFFAGTNGMGGTHGEKATYHRIR